MNKKWNYGDMVRKVYVSFPEEKKAEQSETPGEENIVQENDRVNMNLKFSMILYKKRENQFDLHKWNISGWFVWGEGRDWGHWDPREGNVITAHCWKMPKAGGGSFKYDQDVPPFFCNSCCFSFLCQLSLRLASSSTARCCLDQQSLMLLVPN